jgi:hypothetical protein
MAVPVPQADRSLMMLPAQRVTLRYETPGRAMGLLPGGVSLLLLIALIVC